MLPRVVFLDRDGVINRDSPRFVRSLADWRPIEGSLDAIAALSRAGCRIVVVTNQSGVARRLVAPTALDRMHDALRRAVAERGGRVDAVLVCPHAPEAGCACRKPRPGLIERAARELGLDPRGAPFVGDRRTDLEAARAAGCRPIWVRSGAGREEELGPEWSDVPRLGDLAEAAAALLEGRLAASDPPRDPN